MFTRVRRLLPLTLLLVVACAGAPPRPPGGVTSGDFSYLKQRMTWEIEQAIDERDLASVAIAVVSDQEIVWEQGFGRPDPAKAATATPDTVYRIGSVSKTMTGIAILQLVDLGLVDLDAPLTTYLPAFTLKPPPAWLPESEGWSVDDITVRRVMTHHAGIPGDRLAGMISTAPWDYHQLPALLAEEHASHPTDLVHSYSNNAISLLGLIVEAVTGETFEDYTRENILLPAGMPTAAWHLTPELRKRYAPPHDKGKVQKHYDLAVVPAGTLYSSVHEMASYAKTLLAHGEGPEGMVLSRARLEEMWTEQNADVGLDLEIKQGLIFFIDALVVDGAKRTVFHNGATLNHRASFVVLPEEQLAVVVLSNSGKGMTDSLAKKAASLALEAKVGFPFDETEPDPPEVGDLPPKDVVDPLVGGWDSGLGFIDVKRGDGGLLAGDGLSFETLGVEFLLEPTTRGTWTPSVLLFGFFPLQPEELAKLEIKFDRIGERQVMMAVDPEGRRQLFGSKLDPPAPSKAWRKAAGLYRIKDNRGDAPIFKALRLDAEGDVLRLFLVPDDDEEPALPLALGPTGEEHAFILGLGRNRGDSVRRGEHGGKPSLWYSGWRFELAPDDKDAEKKAD
jgi:CubicO group peptidase (beta-lactamase class C family)